MKDIHRPQMLYEVIQRNTGKYPNPVAVAQFGGKIGALHFAQHMSELVSGSSYTVQPIGNDNTVTYFAGRKV